MAKSFQRDITDLRRKYSLLKYKDCTAEESEEFEAIYKKDSNLLPEDIEASGSYASGNLEYVFRHVHNNTDISHEERIEYLLLKQTNHLSAIRKMLLFFVVLTCISLVTGLILTLKASGS